MSDEGQTTDWFQPNVAPVRAGFYDIQTKGGSSSARAYFRLDGVAGWYADDTADAKAVSDLAAWRGLAQPPK